MPVTAGRALACAVLFLSLACASSAAAAKPDLRAAPISPDGTVTVGAVVHLTDTTRNAGSGRAGASTTAFFISRDKKFGKGDVTLGQRKVGKLKPGKRSIHKIGAKAPARLGTWFVLACADAAHRVRESKEGNNCSAAAKQLTITAPATQPGPAPTQPAPSGNPNPDPGPTPTQPTPDPPTPDPNPDPGGGTTPGPCDGGPVGGSGNFTGNSHNGCGPPVWGGCQVFPDDNAWNQDIRGLAVDPMSDTWTRYAKFEDPVTADDPDPVEPWNLRVDWGGGDYLFYGIPFTIVPFDQPLLPLTYGVDFEDYGDESDPGPYPFPPDIYIEAQDGTTDPPAGDRHAIALRQGDCKLFETYKTVRQKTGSNVTGFKVASSATFDLTTNATRPAGWTSADASGMAIFPGLAKAEEAATGSINHALRFTTERAQKAYVPPANHFGQFSDPCYPPYGARFRLKESFDLSGYSGDALAILEAAKKYGLILADQGSAGFISGVSSAGWDDIGDINLALRDVPGTAFEVVQTGTLTRGFAAPANFTCP